MISSTRIAPEVLAVVIESCDALDAFVADAVRREVRSRIDGSADVVLDLSAVQFIDSTGVGVLVGVLKAARRCGRDAAFACVNPGVRSVLEVVKLDRILELYDDVASASAALCAVRARPSVRGA